MHIDPWPPRDPPRRVSGGLRAIALAVVSLWLALALFGAWKRPNLELREIVEEGYHAFEWAQVWLWIATGVLAVVACAAQRVRRGVLLSCWLGVAAGMAALREMDLHVLLNPGNIHLLGLEAEHAVRFRADWWMDSATPVGLRACWAAVFAVVGAVLVLPFALARYPWPRRLLRLGGFAWLVASGIGLLGLAYVEDDLLRGIASNSLIEEVLEVAGQSLLLIATALLALGRVRLHGEEAKPGDAGSA